MRLGTCIALELAAAVVAIGGAWFAASHTADVAGDYLRSREAVAATASLASAIDPPAAPPLDPRRGPGGAPSRGSSLTSAAPKLAPLERARLPVAPPAPTNVFGAPDPELLAPLGATPVVKVKLNHGGTSLSLRLDFASGARAAFKPQQVHLQSEPRREIAAYRIDRLLGIGRVPPARSAAFAVADLVAAAEPGRRAFTAARLAEEALAVGGVVRGELSWWIPQIKPLRIGGHLIDEPEGMARWIAYLQVGAVVPAELRPVLAQIATVVLFDVLIDNPDRWSGNNAQGSPDHRVLYFMDNTLSFSLYTIGHATNLSKLYRIQVFPRALVDRLRRLTGEDIAGALGGEDDLLGPLLTDAEIRAIISRRDRFLEYIDRLIAELGDDAVLAFP